MRLVLVEWNDAFADVGWSDSELDTIPITSVGILVFENDKKVVLSGMKGGSGLADAGTSCKHKAKPL